MTMEGRMAINTTLKERGMCIQDAICVVDGVQNTRLKEP